MPIQPQPLAWHRTPIVDEQGYIQPDFLRWLQYLEAKTGPTLTLAGQFQNQAPISGRTEPIGTTAQHLTAAGLLDTADSVAADGAAFVRVNPNQRTGAGRAFIALDANNRLANSARMNPVNAANAPTAATVLSNNGVATSIVIAASTMQFGSGQVSYNSGSVEPGAFGTFFIFADDPTFAGGAVSYQFTTDAEVALAAEGRILFGKITTAGGAARTGGGNTGGTTPGGGGGKGYIFE